MNLCGPGDRYSLAVEVLASTDGRSFTRHRVTTGVPFREGQGAAADPASYLVVVADACLVVLSACENGLLVRSVKLLNAARALIIAAVTAGPGAPDSLPTDSIYVIFDGDRLTARGLRDRYVPLDGTAAASTVPREDPITLDRLAVAIGRSVARANATLARSRAEGGVGLVSSVTMRLAVAEADIGQGRVLVGLARPGRADTGQFVEFTMTTAPGAPDDLPDEEP